MRRPGVIGFCIVVLICFALGFYYSPRHFGFDLLTARDAFNQGVALDKEDKLDKAIEWYDIAIRRNPEIAEAFNNRGLFALGLNTLRKIFAAGSPDQIIAFLAQLLSPKLPVKPLLSLAF